MKYSHLKWFNTIIQYYGRVELCNSMCCFPSDSMRVLSADVCAHLASKHVETAPQRWAVGVLWHQQAQQGYGDSLTENTFFSLSVSLDSLRFCLSGADRVWISLSVSSLLYVARARRQQGVRASIRGAGGREWQLTKSTGMISSWLIIEMAPTQQKVERKIK